MIFSIIIPIYNVAKYLPKCLDSVLGQSFTDFEVICVNDGSTDDSLSVLEQYAARDARIKVISQANGGLSAARNTGINNAHGKYILFLDSDDWIESNTLQVLDDHLAGEDLLCFNGRKFVEEKNCFEPADNLKTETNISGWDYYCHHALESRRFAFVCVVLRCYRREYLINNNLLFKTGIFHEDNLFTPLACFYAKKVSIIPDCLYNYRIRSNSIMTTRSLKHRQDIIQIANSLSAFFIGKSDIDRTVVFQALTHHYQSVFLNSTSLIDHQLLPLIDWKSYKAVSQTKFRHRLQYLLIKITPSLFRLFLRSL